MRSEKYTVFSSSTFPETNSSHLKMDGWKMISFWVSAYVQGRTVSFLGCIQWIFLIRHPEVGTLGPDGGHLHISVANKERNLRRNQCKGVTKILY